MKNFLEMYRYSVWFPTTIVAIIVIFFVCALSALLFSRSDGSIDLSAMQEVYLTNTMTQLLR